MNHVMDAQLRVRLKGASTQIGITTDLTEKRGDRLYCRVMFPERDRWVPIDQLEVIGARQETPIDLFREGKFGTASDLRRTITHARITGRLADFIYSLEATNTDFYPYQFKPVLKLLQSPTNSLLIADEVGLGKTIEAGLIWIELRARFDLRRLVVICPKALREKWKYELTTKMGVRAEIVDARRMQEVLEDETAGEQGFAIIGSMQGLRPVGDLSDDNNKAAAAELARSLIEHESEEPLVDLLIVDEAHYMRTPGTRTLELGQLVRSVSDYAVFLSATPIHNKNDDLHSILNLVDPDTFARPQDFESIMEANRPLVRARDLVLSAGATAEQVDEQLEFAREFPLLSDNRQLRAIRKAVNSEGFQKKAERSRLAYQLETVNLLGHVVTRTRKREVQQLRVVRDPVPEGIDLHPLEREFYDQVTAVVADYADARSLNQKFLLAQPQRQMTSCMAAALEKWQGRGRQLEGFQTDPSIEWTDEQIEEIVGPLSMELARRSKGFGNVAELAEVDTKFERLLSRLKGYLADYPHEKIVLFSTFIATLEYLEKRLVEEGISSVLFTGQSGEGRDQILDTFRDPGGPSVLLSSEVGSEGVDLQFSRLIINYDLPWNPMRLEQRVGRLDRIGQLSEKITIWNLFHEDTIDGRIYRRLYDKLDLCRQALGDFETVLGDEIREMTRDLLDPKLDAAQQEARIDQTAQALENIREVNNELEENAAELVAYGDYILNQVEAAHDLYHWVTPEDLKIYVSDFLKSVKAYRASELRRTDSDALDFEIRLSQEAKADLAEFVRKERVVTTTNLLRSQSRPSAYRFDTKANAPPGVHAEIINQFHPLVRFASAKIAQADFQMRPAVAVEVEGEFAEIATPGIYAIGISFWSIEGLRPTEKLFYSGMNLSDEELVEPEECERLALAAAMHGNDWLTVHADVDVEKTGYRITHELLPHMQHAYEEFVDQIRAQNEDRADLQLKGLSRHLQRSLDSLQEVRCRHAAKRDEKMVRLTDGRIAALQDRFRQEELKIEGRRHIQSETEDACLTLVHVI